jgi:ATP-binding cassette subfamily C (CFTR/MRP) protein 1
MGAYFFTRSILLTMRTLEGKDDTVFDAEWKGWVLTIFFFIDAWLLGIALQRMGYCCIKLGIKVRAALITTVARKCYNMAHLSKETSIAAVGFVATDINKVGRLLGTQCASINAAMIASILIERANW